MAKQYDSDVFSMSNYLIGAKYKASLTQLRVIALSLFQLSKSYEDKDGNIVTIISPGQYQRTFNITTSVYNQLQEVAPSLTGMVVGNKDDKNRKFKYVPLISLCEYENESLKIIWNKYAKPYLFDYQDKFTKLRLPILAQFTSVYSFKIYELLKMDLYKKKVIEYDLAELQLELGTVNASLEKVKRFLNNKVPDYEKAVEISPEKIYIEWGDFKKRVILPALKEINEKTDLQVEFVPIKKGRGGRVAGLQFYVTEKKLDIIPPEESHLNTSPMSEDDLDDFIDQLRSLFKQYNLTTKELKNIAKIGKYDYKNISEKYVIMQKSSKPINNVVGWMKSALQEDYSEPKQSSFSFTNFEQTKLNLDDLEHILIDN